MPFPKPFRATRTCGVCLEQNGERHEAPGEHEDTNVYLNGTGVVLGALASDATCPAGYRTEPNIALLAT